MFQSDTGHNNLVKEYDLRRCDSHPRDTIQESSGYGVDKMVNLYNIVCRNGSKSCCWVKLPMQYLRGK